MSQEPDNKELQMKRIITHFLGDISFEANNLQQFADMLDRGQERPDVASTASCDGILAGDYSVDPLSSNLMRKFSSLRSILESFS